ncbi:MAG: Rne/Rng family ribonuclease [Deltaproteobacteria bacterium]|nr:Rne/Rng family ribonuclease [Deltaproteobacteria bacterium]MBW2413589.1 Rne/Rng family ribonuclease [Deltaproteobacteria bacterium]
MRNEIFANVGPRETRVAVREADRVVELHIERSAERGVGQGIFKGRVTRVLPGMQAAFVDIGLERAGFLYVTDYRADLEDVDLGDDDSNGDGGGAGSNGSKGEGGADSGRNGRGRGRGRGRGGRNSRGASQRGDGVQIEDVLQEGQEILVQVAKEPLGTKGARITSRISLAGRHLVLMPSVSRIGVSRRIASDKERRRLRSLVDKHRPKDLDLGFIVRTVSHGVSEADIKADIEYLTERWQMVQKRVEAVDEVPALIYEEPPLHLRLLRDLVTHETKQVVVDDDTAYGEMQDFVKRFMASPRPKITHARGSDPLFDAYRIEGEIEEGLGRKVWLKSGGYLVIDQSEALTAIDVNTGRFTGGKGRNLEETILKTNLEAVREIVRQLRFRNIGGLIILDLIDMEVAANREKVYRTLLDLSREDKSRVNLLKISELGLVEMTRKRTRENLVQQLCDPCPNCEGRGYVQSTQTVCYKIFRELPKAAGFVKAETLSLRAHPEVAEILLDEDAETLLAIEARIGRKVTVEPVGDFHVEQFEITAGVDDGVVRPWQLPAEPVVEAAPEPAVAATSEPAAEAVGEQTAEATSEYAAEAPGGEPSEATPEQPADEAEPEQPAQAAAETSTEPEATTEAVDKPADEAEPETEEPRVVSSDA